MQKSEKLAMNKKLASELLKEIAYTNNINDDRVTLFDIKSAFRERGFGILIVVFSLPLSVPIPVPPGYTTIFSIPLILFSMQLLLGFESPWMPSWLEKRSFRRSTLAIVIEKTSSSLRRIEKFMKPRMFLIFYGPGEKILAFIMLLCALSIAIPLPLTNFIPAIGTTLISLGIMNKDGLLSILGVLLSLCGLLLTLIVIIKGPQLILGVFSFLKSFVYG
ncbi:MAG: exopolysaccharide biosynthesis protein [Wolbachia endosymbiont of Meromenopon meropis]|nr:exopolysaccharide biosynthesis protein [Wolbachia endosymbiont of Meromenopon meropis]